jgi:hypothetical protein
VELEQKRPGQQSDEVAQVPAEGWQHVLPALALQTETEPQQSYESSQAE